MFDPQFLAFSKKNFNTVISFFMAENPLCRYVTIFSSVGEYISWFHFFLAVGNSAAINMDVPVSLWYIDLESLGSIPTSGRAITWQFYF